MLSSTTSLRLHNDAATVSAAGVTNSVLPTATTFSVADNYNHNGSGHVAYCFHSVAGYSKVSSYIGNGSEDGTFVYCGFRPAFVLIRCSTAAEQWWIFDSARDVDNVAHYRLAPNGSGIEGSNIAAGADNIDFVSNGIKIRSRGGSVGGNSGETYIFLAIAESPFKNTNAR